jgi:hypothetical protein
VVGLGRVLVATDKDEPSTEDTKTVYILESHDGTYRQELSDTEDGTLEEGGINVIFEDVPTLGKRYTLYAQLEDSTSCIFEELPFEEIGALGDKLASNQVAPRSQEAEEALAFFDSESGDTAHA